ncbi:hypothetical protein I5677_11465 [Mobilitalea sibirica]|uniref:Tetratricopeptide repeat protein n=1 Tax=Mobilitalea sibirica TaxID=1462919 RepID=A0A8J7HD12_9FIRM|nr:hypothetical protein [Mobilitalea sibirica]MBH1941512.1 hypothetical protein [Mobilitalea sibirica]
MGKMILCSGLRTTRPYVFTTTGIRIYSIEELCYYIWKQIYFIDKDMFSEALIDWIGAELNLTHRAEKLRVLRENNADLKTLVTAILCSADYYSEYEIKSILKMVDEIADMPLVKRNFIRANSYLKNQQYIEAAGEYERILNSDEVIGLTPEEYGDILHNLAVAIIHSKGSKEAIDIFREAYERNNREKTLLHYLYSIRLSNNIDLFCKKCEEYQISNDVKEELLKKMDREIEEANESDMMDEIKHLKNLRIAGKIHEFHQKAEGILERWMSLVRNS